MKIFPSFQRAINELTQSLLTRGHRVKPNSWQSMDVSQRAEAETLEVLNPSFQVPLPSTELSHYREDITPNLPWADRHFELERVSRHPINPGTTWKEWPWGLSADKFRVEGEQYSHSYAERYWGKYAGKTPGGLLTGKEETITPNRGTRYPYGDLDDVVQLLKKDPLTRQAVLAVWYPEDHGAAQNQRVPCSLFYQFIQRMGYFHIIYTIRSCDALRHFRDDIYLTIRLHLWVLNELRKLDPDTWGRIIPGFFTMHITSLHCFVGDIPILRKQLKDLL